MGSFNRYSTYLSDQVHKEMSTKAQGKSILQPGAMMEDADRYNDILKKNKAYMNHVRTFRQQKFMQRLNQVKWMIPKEDIASMIFQSLDNDIVYMIRDDQNLKVLEVRIQKIYERHNMDVFFENNFAVEDEKISLLALKRKNNMAGPPSSVLRQVSKIKMSNNLYKIRWTKVANFGRQRISKVTNMDESYSSLGLQTTFQAPYEGHRFDDLGYSVAVIKNGMFEIIELDDWEEVRQDK